MPTTSTSGREIIEISMDSDAARRKTNILYSRLFIYYYIITYIGLIGHYRSNANIEGIEYADSAPLVFEDQFMV